MPPRDASTDPTITLLDVAVFLAELLMLAALAVAGARLGSRGLSVVLGVVLPLVAVTLWALLLAPRAPRRLPSPARLAGKLGLVVAAAALLAASGAVAWAVAFLVVTAAVFVAGERGAFTSA